MWTRNERRIKNEHGVMCIVGLDEEQNLLHALVFSFGRFYFGAGWKYIDKSDTILKWS